MAKLNFGGIMENENTDLMNAGNLAKGLKISDAKIKKAIKDLGIQPVAKKGVCNYYSRAALEKIKVALNK
jgi:hypothetical protein